MRHIIFISVCLILCFSTPATAFKGDLQLKYDNGLVSFKTGSISLVNFLGHLSDLANIQIFTTKNIADGMQEIHLDQVPLKHVLDKFLRGYNYAVIYSGGSEPGGLFSCENNITFRPVYANKKYASAIKGTASNIKTAHDRLLSRRESATGLANTSLKRTGLGYHSSKTSFNKKERAYESTVAVPARSGSTNKVNSKQVASYTSNANADSGSHTTESGTAVSDTSKALLAQSDSVDPPEDTDSDSSDDNDSDRYDTVSNKELKVMVLESKIKDLQEYIDSGTAEEFYSFWTTQKDPKYVYNPWDDLARQETKLEQLRSN